MSRAFMLLAGCCAVAACANQPAAKSVPTEAVQATRIADPAKPVEIVQVPQLLPLPGQLKPLPSDAAAPADNTDPLKRVKVANDLARVEPANANFIDATQVWPYSPNALYQLYTSPEKISDITLEAGEELVSVSAGDTVRWIIGDTTSGTGATLRVHVLVKPARPDLRTNLLINTNRRTYHLELSSTPQTWMSSVSWAYPLDQLMLRKAENAHAQAVAPIAQGIALERLNFSYEITGDATSWRPVRAFDDGEKVYLQFPADIVQGDMPPLFIVGDKNQAELVNYRVTAQYYIVDRLFDVAELRLGGKNEHRVRVERIAAARTTTGKHS